jgi:hypothetical protein
VELSKFKSDNVQLEDAILKEREKPLQVVSSDSKIEANTLMPADRKKNGL